MIQPIRRYLVRSQAPSVDAVNKGLAQAVSLAQETPAKHVILLTPTKDQLRFTAIAEALGEPAAKALLGNGEVRFRSGVRLTHQTERTFGYVERDVVLLVVFGAQRLLDKADGCPLASAIVAVPDIMHEVREWAKRWGPQMVGEATQGPAERLIENAIVEKALEWLTDYVNLSNDLLTDSDRGAAIEMLKRLRDAGELYDPSAVRSWALQHGWSLRGADRLGDVAQAVLERRRLRAGREQHWGSNLIEMLRIEVRGGTSESA